MTMATGGVANVLHKVPYEFPGLYVNLFASMPIVWTRILIVN